LVRRAAFGDGRKRSQAHILLGQMTHQEILADFPYLTEADILACLSYAADREHHLTVSRE
jgi:uncharacterized protein (DUF433 family)